MKPSILLLITLPAFAQSAPASAPAGVPKTVPASAPPASAPAARADGIKLPADDDDYSRLVRRAQDGDETVDFRELRLAYIKSAAFLRERIDETRRFRDEMHAGMKAQDDAKVRAAATGLLGIVYIDLEAQKILRQACAALHDDACANRHHFIEFGLIKSITRTGDGKSCAGAWEVVRLEEEYFILRMLDTKMQKQALVSSGNNSCDEMQGLDEKGAKRTYYFKVNALFEGYKRHGIK